MIGITITFMLNNFLIIIIIIIIIVITVCPIWLHRVFFCFHDYNNQFSIVKNTFIITFFYRSCYDIYYL